MKLLLLLLLPVTLLGQNQTWYYNKVFTTDYNLKQGKNLHDTLDLKGSWLPIKYLGDLFILGKDTLLVSFYSQKLDTLLDYDFTSEGKRVAVYRITPMTNIEVQGPEGDKGAVFIWGDVMFLDYLLNDKYRRVKEYRLVTKIASASDKGY